MVGHADCAVKKLAQGISTTVSEGAVSTTCVSGWVMRIFMEMLKQR